jgi:tRNA (uracil-5-)-methyltransferase
MTSIAVEKINYTEENYRQQLDLKLEKFRLGLSVFGEYPVEVHESVRLGFRMRAEFRIWHEAGRAHYAMNNPGEKRPYIVDEFPIASSLITNMMGQLLSEINKIDIIRNRLFSAEFLTTLSGETLVTLIYHKPLDHKWENEARLLESRLSILIIGRARKQKVILTRDFVTEKLSVGNKKYLYQQKESGFTQPNAMVNINMLEWASSVCSVFDKKSDLLELYCGNGNFTAVLAQHFNRVLATEVSKVSVASAEANFILNEIKNIAVVRLSSEEITEALEGKRPFRRLKEHDLSTYKFSTVFVDPPRSGLDIDTENFIKEFTNIIYISCNPTTLISNLSTLTKTHNIAKVAAFDQFPWTDHLETGVFLSKSN